MNEDLERVITHAGFKSTGVGEFNTTKEGFFGTEDNFKRLIYFVVNEIGGATVSTFGGDAVSTQHILNRVRGFYGIETVEWENEPKWVDPAND